MLKEAAAGAARRYGGRCDAFADCVAARLAMGEDLYPERYLTADLPREILEEAHDAAAYALLDAQKTLASRFEGGEARVQCAYEIIELAAAIDDRARMLRHCD